MVSYHSIADQSCRRSLALCALLMSVCIDAGFVSVAGRKSTANMVLHL